LAPGAGIVGCRLRTPPAGGRVFLGKVAPRGIAMSLTLWTLTCLLALPAPGGDAKQKRERHPFAPSLPLLTEKESEAIDKIIDRFIEVDVGKLKGKEALQATKEFQALGPPAIPNLIDGLNRAANLE